jgi:hypothetical protein
MSKKKAYFSSILPNLPSAHHPDRHIIERFNDFLTETAPEVLLGKTDDLSAAHYNSAEIAAKSGFNNFMDSIAFDSDKIAGYPIGVESR